MSSAWDGYSYHVTDEEIREWKAVSIEKKLQWLADAYIFLQECLPEDKKRIMEAFRRGQPPENFK